MSDKLCKFQNSGYCKYKENCKFKHVTEICENKCDRKTCMKRHQKLCKFESRCRRQGECEYKHLTAPKDMEYKAHINGLEAKMTKLVQENKSMEAKMKTLGNELRSHLKKAEEVNKEKDTTIKVLKEKLTIEEDKNTQLKKKSINITKETLENDKVKTTDQVLKVKDASTESLKCDKCGSGGMNQNDLKRHKQVKHGEVAFMLEPEVLLNCDRCKFRTTDKAHFKRHTETFVHKCK